LFNFYTCKDVVCVILLVHRRACHIVQSNDYLSTCAHFKAYSKKGDVDNVNNVESVQN